MQTLPDDTAAITPPAGRPPLPPPLVKPLRHPLRWTWNKLQLLVAAVLLAYIGMHIVVAVYYLIFQTTFVMNHFWHQAVSDDSLRHTIRNVAEGLLGGLLAQQVIWNHFRRRKAMNRLDHFEIAVHIANVKDDKRLSVGQLLASPFLALIYAVPGFAIALLAAYVIRHNTTHLHHLVVLTQAHIRLEPHVQLLLIKVRGMWAQNWDQKLAGYGASLFFGRRPVKGVFDDLQLWFVERRITLGKPVRWYHPPTFQARYNHVLSTGITPGGQHGLWMTALIRSGLILGLALAAFGLYIMTFIAG